MPTDAELLTTAQKGDVTSLGALLERYRPRLHAVALALLGYGPQAEDAVHETFLIALNKLQQVREPGAVGGWLHAILRNVCRMSLRGRREEIPIEALPPGAEPTTDLSDATVKLTGSSSTMRRALRSRRSSGLDRTFSEASCIFIVMIGSN